MNYGLGEAQRPRWSHFELRQSRPVRILTLVRPAQSLVAMLIMITRPLICIVKVKMVNCPPVKALRLFTDRRPIGGVKVLLYSSLTAALEGGEGSASRPGRSLLPGKTRYPFYRRLGGLQERFGEVRKILPPPGFDTRTLQHVASHFTDYATRPAIWIVVFRKYVL